MVSPEGREGKHRGRLERHEGRELSFGQRGEVAHDVAVVDAWTVAAGCLAGLRFEIQTEDSADADRPQHLSADAVPRTQVKYALCGRWPVELVQNPSEQADDPLRRAHPEFLAEDAV